MVYYYWQNNNLFLKIYVQPNAKKNALVGLYGDRLKIQIKAPPTDEKANKELVKFLANFLHIASSKIDIVSGLRSRNKLVCLAAMAMDPIPELAKLMKDSIA